MTMRLSLLIGGDASEAVRAADNTRRAVAGVAQAASTSAQAAEAGARRTTAAIVGMAAAVNQFANIRDFGTAQRAADIAAYGQELDRVRGKFNPLFAAGQEYKARLLEISEAAKVGAISERERAAAIERTKAAFANQVVMLNASAKAQGLNTFQMQNMAFQMNDMATMLASGQSPFVMLMQQGMQISQIFKPGTGLGAALAEVGGAIVSFVTNPLNLAVLGFAAAAGGAALLWRAITNSGGADTSLERHEALIARIKEAYGQAGTAAQAYARESQTVVSVLAARQIDDLRKQLDAGVKGLVSTLGNLNQRGQFQLDFRYQGLTGPIETLRKELKDGVPDLVKFDTAIASLAQSDAVPAYLKDLIANILKFDEAANKAQRAVAAFRSNLDAAGRLAPWSPLAANDMDSYASYVISQDAAMARQRQQNAADLQGINARSPSEKASAARATAAATYNDDEMPLARQMRIDQAAAMALAEAEHGLAEAQRDRLRSYDATLKGAQLDIDLIGRTAGETARLRMEYQLTGQLREEAAKNGIAVDRAELEIIKQKSAAAGELATTLASATLRDNLGFDRAQLGRSDIDQTIATTLRGAGLAIDFNSTEAGMIRVNEQLKLGHDLLFDFASGFRNDLKNGVTDIDALGNALGRLKDKLWDLAVNQGVNALYSAITGAFGIGAAVPLAGGTPLGQGGIGRMRGGGAIFGPGTGTSDSVLIAASNGEFMVNAAATARHRPLLEAINDNRPIRGYAAGGYVGAGDGSGGAGGTVRVRLELVTEGGAPVAARDGGTRNEGGVDVQRLIVGAVIDDVQNDGPLSKTLAGTFGMRRQTR
ncbi:MAG: phage tail length tape measure family protein [Bauldia sp.]